MKHLSPRYVLLSVSIFLLATVSIAVGQDGPPLDGPPPQRPISGEGRPNLLRELGLSPDQIQQIRKMNQSRKPLMEEAAKRLRDANRALDMAIYSDAVNEEEFVARLRDFQLAQAEMAKLRFQNELGVRKILTPEQLIRFRSLRDSFARARENFQDRQMPPPAERPLQKMRQQRQQRKPDFEL